MFVDDVTINEITEQFGNIQNFRCQWLRIKYLKGSARLSLMNYRPKVKKTIKIFGSVLIENQPPSQIILNTITDSVASLK